MNIDNILALRAGLKPGVDGPFKGLKPDITEILWAEKIRNVLKKVTIKGNPLHFKAKKAQTAISTKITMEPIQEGSGDPSPTNIRPISGRTQVSLNGCGKNLVDVPDQTLTEFPIKVADITILGRTYTASADVAIVGSTGGRIRLQYNMNGETVYSTNPMVDTGKSIATLNIPLEATNASIYLQRHSNATSIDFSNIQLEFGTEASSYEPYAESNNVTITFPAVGKNKLDMSSAENGYLNVTCTTIQPSDKSNIVSDYIEVIPGMTYYYTAYPTQETDNWTGYGFFEDKDLSTHIGNQTAVNGNQANRVSITVPNNSDIKYIRIGSRYLQNGGKAQLEQGSTATAYEPYTNTVYGGTLDVEKGELVVDRTMVDLGTLEWTYNTSFSNPIFYVPLNDKVNDSHNVGICSIYKFNSTNATGVQNAASITNNKGFTLSINTITPSVYVRDDSYVSKSDFENAMNGVQLVYELATPTTVSLTPEQVQILKGVNNIWTDGNEIELTYKN